MRYIYDLSKEDEYKELNGVTFVYSHIYFVFSTLSAKIKNIFLIKVKLKIQLQFIQHIYEGNEKFNIRLVILSVLNSVGVLCRFCEQ